MTMTDIELIRDQEARKWEEIWRPRQDHIDLGSGEFTSPGNEAAFGLSLLGEWRMLKDLVQRLTAHPPIWWEEGQGRWLCHHCILLGDRERLVLPIHRLDCPFGQALGLAMRWGTPGAQVGGFVTPDMVPGEIPVPPTRVRGGGSR